jgi:MOSC domain-containing protein YiiM
MNIQDSAPPAGRVASLHLHPEEPGRPLRTVACVELVQGKGIQGDHRYFGKLSRQAEQPSRRQVSLIEREQIEEHATAVGLKGIPAGAVRSNIETEGIQLAPLLGREIQVGEAILFIYERRDPCAKMDALCRGLRARMMDGRQGVLAEVRRSGQVRVGDTISIFETGRR